MAKEDPGSIYFYHPSFPLTIVAAVLYLIPTVILFYQTCFRYKTWYFLCVPIGSIMEVVGYGIRANSVKHVADVGPYASSQSLIVIAPLFIAAGNYLLIGRLIIAVLPSTSHKVMGIRATRITKVFVGLDILSFLIQVSGSGIASSGNWSGNLAKIGVNVLIAGLSSQLATILIFIIVVSVFSRQAVWRAGAREGAPAGWEKVLAAIVISCVLITIRSMYRLVEFALGVEGYPFSHEWTFYVLESLPMLPAIAIFCLWYPGRYLPKKKFADDMVGPEIPMVGNERERHK